MKELYESSDKACDYLKEMAKEDDSFKKSWSRIAKRCVAYANGDQSKSGSSDNRGIESIIIGNQPVMSKDNSVAGYQGNEIAPVCRTLGSFLCGNKPSATAENGSDRTEDKNIAKVSEKILEAKYDIDDEYNNSSLSAFWSMATGSVFAKDFWDSSKGDFRTVNPATLEPEGDNEVAILTPFQMINDNSITDFNKSRWVGEHYLSDVEWARDVYDREDAGYTGKAADIQEANDMSEVLKHYEDMKMAVPFIGSKSSGKSKGKCLVKEFHIKPNATYPLGRYIIQAGGCTVYDSPAEIGSPYFMEYSPTMWHPYTHFYWEPYVGRLLGKSLVEQLIPLQMRLNELNSAIVQNAGTLAKPNILSAKGQLEKGIWDGGGYKVYIYNNIPAVGPPQFQSGMALPAQFFNERDSITEQIVRIAGTNFVMNGGVPKGVTAAAAIQQLLENANTQQSDLSNRWHIYHEQRFTKKLRLIHKFNQIPNEALNKKLKLITRGCLDVQIDSFIGATDLSDGIYVNIEQGSMLGKSKVAEREIYKELLGSGGLSPVMAEDSPRGNKLRTELAEKMGVSPLEVEETNEVKKAKWENQRLMKLLPTPVGEFDIHAIHLPEHKIEIQNPSFLESATPEQMASLTQHIYEHMAAEEQAMMMEQQKQMQQAMMQGLPAGAPAPDGAAPQMMPPMQ